MTDGRKGGPKPRVSDDELLAIFREAREPVLTASEVAEGLPIGRRAVHKRLRDLEARGELKSKKVGGRSAVWWAPGHTSTAATEDSG